MIAWALGRGITGFCRACGMSEDDAESAGLIGGSLCFPFDPVGALANIAHATAKEKAKEGNEVAKVVNIAMSATIMVSGVGDLAAVVNAASTAGGAVSCVANAQKVASVASSVA